MSHTRSRIAMLFALFALAALLLAGCSNQSSPTPANTSEQTGAASGQTEPQAPAETPPAAPGEEPLHTSAVKVTGDEVAVLKTDKGEVRFKLYPKDAPNTVASFVELAEKGFYNGLKFHRVVPGFVVQGGDPLSKNLPEGDQRIGTGGPGWRLKAEFNQQKHLTGTVAMARSQDPDSAGSQFYICLAPQPSLDGQYTVFGQVTDGMDVVQKIQQGDTIKSITIVHGK